MDGSKNILLINRDDDFLQSSGESLSKAGYNVFTAADMRTALTSLTSHSIHLIICDNALHDVSGYDFLRYLKCDPLREGIPFVFFVPVNDQGNAFKSFKLGAADFLVYPLEIDGLLNRIGRIFTGQGNNPESAVTPGADNDAYEEKRKTRRTLPLPPLKVEVSRDGILWMPGRITNFNQEGLFLKTSLLGKPGAVLNLRFSMPTGLISLQGQIVHVNFDHPHEPAGIGLTVGDCPEWKTIYDHLISFIGLDNKVNLEGSMDDPPPVQTPARDNGAKTMVLPEEESPAAAEILSLLIKKEDRLEESLDSRFYHSLVGKQIDNYKLVSFIGEGNMGGVFKGWDVSLEREAAVKIISFDLSSQEKFREMFIKEARTASRLDHPNIAHIYSIGNTGDILYFAMEYVSGTTLSALIRKGTNLNTLMGLDYLITACQTLSFMKEKNVIHCDIKPENIMVTRDKTIKLVDFGIAQLADTDKKQTTGGIIGSPFYIPPESIEGRPVDYRSDIYSLGATFYHAFTGSPPYEGEDMDDILIQHLNGALPSLKEKNPKISNILARIVERMMAREIQSRYQDYESIINDLHALRDKALQFRRIKNATLILDTKNNKLIAGRKNGPAPERPAENRSADRPGQGRAYQGASV